MDRPMMKCGHVANSELTADGRPMCVICTCLDVDPKPVHLDGRKAKCIYRDCDSEQPSSLTLAFFEQKPTLPADRFYCGCYGWE